MLPIARVVGHREWTSRKSDPVYDMNWRRAGVAGIRPRTEEDFMATMSEAEKATILEAARSVLGGIGGVRNAGQLYLSVYTLTTELAAARREIAALTELVRSSGVDPAVVQAAVTAALGGGLDITGQAIPRRPA